MGCRYQERHRVDLPNVRLLGALLLEEDGVPNTLLRVQDFVLGVVACGENNVGCVRSENITMHPDALRNTQMHL